MCKLCNVRLPYSNSTGAICNHHIQYRHVCVSLEASQRQQMSIMSCTTTHRCGPQSHPCVYSSKPEVLNSSPRAPPLCIFCMSLFGAHCSLHRVHCSLLPEQGNPLKFTLFLNIHSWICAAQRLQARTSVTSYTSVNIYNFNSRLAHFNALWMEYIRSLWTGIMAEYPVMSTSQGTYVPIEQTSEAIRVRYDICRAGGREDWNWEPLL